MAGISKEHFRFGMSSKNDVCNISMEKEIINILYRGKLVG